MLGAAESIGLGVVSPCGAGLAGTGVKALIGIEALGNAINFGENLAAGNYGSAGLDALGMLGNVSQMRRSCFAAGTPLLTPDGSKPIEEFRKDDELLSAPENDPTGPVEVRRVEEVFVRTSPVFTLSVRGQLIRTTAEHPFFVQEAAASGGPRRTGWTKACFLQPGDLLRSHDGRSIALDSISSTAEEVTVYNLRIADYHTYFVGEPSWGFSVWAHNAAYRGELPNKGPSNKAPARKLDIQPRKAHSARGPMSVADAIDHVRGGGDVVAMS